MTDQYGLKLEVIEQVQQVFSRFPEIRTAILYGSRAKGNYRHGSYIDLTLKTASKLPPGLLLRVLVSLDDLDLPYCFDVSLFEEIDNDNLIDHIKRVGIEFYNAGKFKAEKQCGD